MRAPDPSWEPWLKEFRKEPKAEGLYACVVCAENVPRFGTTCERCKRNLEEDRLERESNR